MGSCIKNTLIISGTLLIDHLWHFEENPTKHFKVNQKPKLQYKKDNTKKNTLIN